MAITPQTTSYERHRIGAGRQLFRVPGSRANWPGLTFAQAICQPGHEREQSHKNRCRPGNRQVTPLPLRCNAQMSARFFKGDCPPPTAHKPGQNLQRRVVRIGTGKDLRFIFTRWITHQDPAQQNWIVARFIPNAGLSVALQCSLATTLPRLDRKFFPPRLGILKTLLRSATARPFHAWSPILSGLAGRGWVPQLGIQAQSRDPTGVWRLAHLREQIKHGKTAVTDKDQTAIRQPAGQPSNALQGPRGQLLMFPPAFKLLALRRTQYRQERQPPATAGPRERDQQPPAEPAQATGFDEMRMRRSHRVAVNPLGFEVLSAPSFKRVVKAENKFAGWRQRRKQQSQQDPACGQGRPARTMQDSLLVDETFRLAQSPDTQASRHGALTRGKDRSNQQDFGVPPNALGEQGRKFYNQRQPLGRQCQHIKDPSWKKWSLAYAVCRCFFKDQKWPKSS